MGHMLTPLGIYDSK